MEQIERVKCEVKLPNFPVFEFLGEIEELKSEKEHKLARILLKIAKSKIRYTGKEASIDELSSKEILEYIQEAILEIEMDFENFYNVDFDENEEPENLFQYSFYGVEEIINIDKKNHSIQSRSD
ncbi:MAG: hypothetical protein HQ522_07980 [Bacteroidetes bacterium]|nr:hypothetical protein [Bacteroidota bacterium]